MQTIMDDDVSMTTEKDYKATIYLLQEEIRSLHVRLADAEHTRRGGVHVSNARSICSGGSRSMLSGASRSRNSNMRQLNRHTKGILGVKHADDAAAADDDDDDDGGGGSRFILSSLKSRHVRYHDENNVSGSILFESDGVNGRTTRQMTRYHHNSNSKNNNIVDYHHHQQFYSVERHLRQSFLNDI